MSNIKVEECFDTYDRGRASSSAALPNAIHLALQARNDKGWVPANVAVKVTDSQIRQTQKDQSQQQNNEPLLDVPDSTV
ncbi:MAG: hypothetical protein FRX49_11071 [Trebouxia sp. A1-2]|nr:MAG: hypothetical protein FRX49_11071 [Trebouxia sp. A1-2]